MTKREEEAMAPLTDAEAGAIQAVSEVERLKRAIETLRPLVASPDRITDAAWCRAVEAVLAVADGTAPTARVFTEAEVREVLQQARATARASLRIGGLSTTDYGNAAGREDACDSIAQSLNLALD